MKTFKVDFSKGINVVTDRRLVPEGYVVLADNVDIRSGSMRPFKFPEPYYGASTVIPPGTNFLFEFKNNWFFSQYLREYAAEYVSTQTRVYFCETTIGYSGLPQLIPQKVVNGVQAQLGTIVPTIAPSVKSTTSDTPSNFIVATANTGGNLATGQYSYKISAIVDGNVMPPSGAILSNVPQVSGVNITTGVNTLTWHPVLNATGYVVFGRILGQEQVLFTVGANVTTVVDTGNNSPSGAYASNYQPLNPLSYVYTYVRSVGTMVDESGPSPVSNTISASAVRQVSRNPLNDGFYANATTMTATMNFSTNAGTIIGVMLNSLNTVLTLSAPISVGSPWWVNGLELVFGSDPNSTPYTFTIPYAIVNPTVAPTCVASTVTASFPLGTWQYCVTALAGSLNLSTNTPAETLASPYAAGIVVSSANTNIKVSWNSIYNATGYRIYRFNGTTTELVAQVSANNLTYTDTGTYLLASTTLPAVNTTGIIYSGTITGNAAWNNPVPVSVGQLITVTQNVPLTLLPVAPATGNITLAVSSISFTSGAGSQDQDAVYITQAPLSSQVGMATLYQPAFGTYFFGFNFLNVFTPTGIVAQPVTFLDVPHNAYITGWNIYRAGDAGSTFNFVANQTISQNVFTDTVGTTGLGGTIPTSYPDPDTGGPVVFQPPPVSATAPVLYNGMLFVIDGNYVRWSPIGMPDAIPSTYNQSFAYPPQKLVNYSGAVYVFSEDGVSILSGFTPGTISCQKTRADGCIGPLTPRIVGRDIVYLAKRGIMVLEGLDSMCTTERTIPYRLITDPSAYIGSVNIQPFWWFTTDHTSAYGAVLDSGQNPIPAQDTFGSVTSKDKPLTGLIWEARSFVWQNKYYLYFVDFPTTDFIGNPCWCVDFGTTQQLYTIPVHPITTLGFQPLDVHISSTGECFALLNVSAANDATNQALFAAAESQFNTNFTPLGTPNTQVVYRFNPTYGSDVPMRVRTSEIVAGSPNTRKRWREVRLNGQGSLNVRVFLDGALVTMSNGNTSTPLVLSESPSHPSRILLPPGSWGYSCSVEFCGSATTRLIELGFDPMTAED